MKRLTFVDEDGHVLFDNPAGFPEDIGFTIRELAENEEWGTLDNIAEKLANCEERLKHYEDLDEQGKLLKLPCAVGDIVYRVEQDGSITDLKVFSINIFEDGIQLTCKEMKKYGETCYYMPGFSIGRKVFYTRGEAEAALKEL